MSSVEKFVPVSSPIGGGKAATKPKSGPVWGGKGVSAAVDFEAAMRAKAIAAASTEEKLVFETINEEIVEGFKTLRKNLIATTEPQLFFDGSKFGGFDFEKLVRDLVKAHISSKNGEQTFFRGVPMSYVFGDENFRRERYLRKTSCKPEVQDAKMTTDETGLRLFLKLSDWNIKVINSKAADAALKAAAKAEKVAAEATAKAEREAATEAEKIAIYNAGAAAGQQALLEHQSQQMAAVLLAAASAPAAGGAGAPTAKCYFFNTSGGCRNGDKCRFAH